jgi:hypothetical protein
MLNAIRRKILKKLLSSELFWECLLTQDMKQQLRFVRFCLQRQEEHRRRGEAELERVVSTALDGYFKNSRVWN